MSEELEWICKYKTYLKHASNVLKKEVMTFEEYKGLGTLDDDWCYYSGMPSPNAYINDKPENVD